MALEIKNPGLKNSQKNINKILLLRNFIYILKFIKYYFNLLMS